MQVSYVYKWVHKPTYDWYVGSRTARNAHLDDGYICSSKVVKPLILQNPQEWEKTIIASGSVNEMRMLESTILDITNAARCVKSYNQHNQGAKFACYKHSDETKKKISTNHKWAGKKRPLQSIILKGKKRKPEHIKKWADALRGKPFTTNHIDALKKAFRKFVYITPTGVYETSRDAAIANNISKSLVLCYCKGYTNRGIFYPPKTGWGQERKITND